MKPFSRSVTGITIFVAQVCLASDALEIWTWPNPLPAGNKLNGLGPGNDRFIAVGDAGAILVSTNGVNWTAGNSGQSALNGVANASGLFVAVGELGTILTSPDGTNWTQRTSGTTNSLLAVTYGGGEFVAVGGCDRCDPTTRGTILTSPDGVTWTPRTAGTGWILSATFTMLFMRMACG